MNSNGEIKERKKSVFNSRQVHKFSYGLIKNKLRKNKMDSLNRTLNGRPIVVCELVGHANGAYLINNISVRPEWPIAPTFVSENSRVRRITQINKNRTL